MFRRWLKLNNKMEKYNSFRNDYPEFIYKDYSYKQTDTSINIEYYFEIKGLSEFNPKWSISKLNTHANIDENVLDELIFSLGMVELVSYWKLTCSKTVKVNVRTLTKEQIDWWKKLYLKGLGEFFYLNGISPDDDFMEIISNEDNRKMIPKTSVEKSSSATKRTLIPIGGGKDSAVTLELLKGQTDRYCYIINPRGATTETVNVAGLSDKTILANRKLDKNMILLNEKGFLNGHTPFSAIVAFSSVISAYINDIENVALSNESSANESTVENTDVNHQYSKSYEFETDFIEYESKYINSGVKYFSMLRPISELQIAKLFAGFKEYHAIFKSCNCGSKENVWCSNCPKCLFVYIILSPFLEEKELVDIFGKNMLDDINSKDNFEKLVGLQKEKPFECVGSRYEVNLALQMTIQNSLKDKKELPALLKYYKEKNIDIIDDKDFLSEFDEKNSLPIDFSNILKKKVL